MNATEIIEALDNAADEVFDGNPKMSLFCEDFDREKLKSLVGEVELVQSVGGNEGGGENVEMVLHFKDHDVYLRAEASYYSYHGIDYWDDWEEVVPAQKTITIYESK